APACRKAGCEAVQSVTDGDEALDYLEGKPPFSDRELYPVPRLVLLDLKMPRVSGFEVLSWVRADPALQVMPVVVLSSSSHDVDVRRAYQLGANSYVVKPVAFDSLVVI